MMMITIVNLNFIDFFYPINQLFHAFAMFWRTSSSHSRFLLHISWINKLALSVNSTRNPKGSKTELTALIVSRFVKMYTFIFFVKTNLSPCIFQFTLRVSPTLSGSVFKPLISFSNLSSRNAFEILSE